MKAIMGVLALGCLLALGCGAVSEIERSSVAVWGGHDDEDCNPFPARGDRCFGRDAEGVLRSGEFEEEGLQTETMGCRLHTGEFLTEDFAVHTECGGEPWLL